MEVGEPSFGPVFFCLNLHFIEIPDYAVWDNDDGNDDGDDDNDDDDSSWSSDSDQTFYFFPNLFSFSQPIFKH